LELDADPDGVCGHGTILPAGPAAPRTTLAIQQQRSTAFEFQFVRGWWSAMALVEQDRYPGRTGSAIRMVLRAFGEAAMRSSFIWNSCAAGVLRPVSEAESALDVLERILGARRLADRLLARCSASPTRCIGR